MLAPERRLRIGLTIILTLALVVLSGRAFVATEQARQTRLAREQATEDLLRAPMKRDDTPPGATKVPASCAAVLADALRRGADPNARYAPPPEPPRATQWFDDVLRIPTWTSDYIAPIRARWPVLLEAAVGGDVASVRLLLSHGADPNALVCGQPLPEFLNSTWKVYRTSPKPAGTDAAVVQCAALIAAAAKK